MKWLRMMMAILWITLALSTALLVDRPSEGADGISIPIKAGIIVDESNPLYDTESPPFQGVRRLLDTNRIPWEALDISAGQHYSFLDDAGSPLYSTILINVPGEALDASNSDAIVNVVSMGAGAVALQPDYVNTHLAAMFGITTLGTQYVTSEGIFIERDEFTFAYAGETIPDAGMLLFDHAVSESAVVVAHDTAYGNPAIWVSRYGNGKTVFFNTNLPGTLYLQGILMQAILYSMPVGLSSPVNAGVVEVDDCTRSYYTPEQLQQLHYDFIGNFSRLLREYNLKSSIFVAFSYSGSTSDFWWYPESVNGVYQFLKDGHEIGWHCGQTHYPLDQAYWDDAAGVDAEVDAMIAATQQLRDRLQSSYGMQLPQIVSYVAPMECIGAYGYQSLDARTDVRYVGVHFKEEEASGGSAAALAVSEAGTSQEGSDNSSTESENARDADGDPYPAEDITYPVTYRDYGLEPGTDMYNLPRVQGDFFLFSRPDSDEYYHCWAMLRCMMESGAPYVIFTHPDESDMLAASGYTDVTMAQVFDAYVIWADYVATHYPFYRWLTTGGLGQVLESRSGYLDARWLPDQMILEIDNAGQNEALQAKTSLYLVNETTVGDTLRLAFSETPGSFSSANHDIVQSGGNYFLYPPGSAGSLAEVPSTPFEFQPVSPNQAPVLDPIGSQDATIGNPISFTVSGSDPDGDSLLFSASNLPEGASFDAGSRSFSWTPDTRGVYVVHFEVSDGMMTDWEDVSISVSPQPGQEYELTLSVAAGADDGFSGAWGYYRDQAWYEIGQWYNGWFRFNDVTVPQGSVVLEAHLNLQQYRWDSGAHLKIQAEKAADPSAPASTSDHASRVRTVTAVDWPSGYSDSGWHASPDISAVIQELVNSFDYSSGGSIQILVDNNGSSSSAEHVGFTFEGNSPPQLYIRYSTNPTTNQPPVLQPIGDKTAIAGQQLSFDIAATDPNGDDLTFSASNLPEGASLDNVTGSFSWTPAATGVYPDIRFEVSDGLLTDSEAITISVYEPSAGGEMLVSLASGADDGFSGAWGYYSTLAWSQAGQPYNVWLRFTDVNIPPGAVIEEAHLEMVHTSWGSGTSLNIRAEKSASPSAPSSAADHTSRVRTSAAAAWTSGFGDWAYHNSPDLAPVIQELVNTYSYSGGTILILLDNNGSAAGADFVSTSFESGSVPRLFIKYGGSGTPANRAPVLDAIGDRTVLVGQQLSFNVTASDPDGDSLTFSASNLPGGASFDTVTGSFSWTPAATGVYPNIVFQVSDGLLTDSEAITVSVFEPSSGGDLLVSLASGADDGFSGAWGYYSTLVWSQAGQPYNAWLRFTDVNIPPGAVIEEAHLEMVHTSWGSGTSLNIRAEKSANPSAPSSTADHNSRARTSAGVAWTSGFGDWAYHNSPNLAPVIQELVDTYSYSGGTMLILLDNNGSAAGADFVSSSFESGSVPRLFIKYGGSGTPANRPPVLDAIGGRTVLVGQQLSFNVAASDPDGDSLTFSASNLPGGASFDTVTGSFSWTPAATGVYPNIVFEVSDGLLTDSEAITINVFEPSSGGDLLVSLASGADDGFSGAWGYYSTLNWSEAGQPYNAWLRFTDVTIPPGAVIEEAHLEMAHASWGSGTILNIRAEKSANPSAPSSTADHTSRARTSAGVAWTSGFGDWAYHDSPNLAPVIQELVNSYSYSGGTILILLDNNGSASGAEFVPLTYESGSIPRLYIKYGGSGTPASQPPVLDAIEEPAPADQPPVLEPVGDRTAVVGQLLTFDVAASDLDGDNLTFSASNLPDGALFDALTGSFSWTPGSAGVFPDIQFEVSDGLLTDSEVITITVNEAPPPPNQPPALDPIGDQTAIVDQLLTFDVAATDPDSDNLTFSASNLPDGAAFDPATRSFSWTPGSAGVFPDIQFEVSDGLLIDSEAITITVEEPVPANQPPVLDPVGDQTAVVDQLLTIDVAASDPDGDNLTFSASNLPDGASFDDLTGSFSWTPGSAGVFPDIRFEVSDGLLTDSEAVTITVEEPATGGEILVSLEEGTDNFSTTWGYFDELSRTDNSQLYGAWFRFTGITLPQNAVILEARLEMVNARWDNATALMVRAEDSGDPMAPSSPADYGSRTRTTAAGVWTSESGDWAYRDSPDLAALIQELVDSNTYSDGTVLIFVEDEGGSSGASFVSLPYEGGAVPRLHIVYA